MVRVRVRVRVEESGVVPIDSIIIIERAYPRVEVRVRVRVRVRLTFLAGGAFPKLEIVDFSYNNLRAKHLVAQKNSGQSCWCRKKKSGHCFRKNIWGFCADSSFDHSSFAPPAALTRFLLGVSYSKHCYKSPKTFDAVSCYFWVPIQYNY